MKFTLAVIINIVICYLTQKFLVDFNCPWWIFAPAILVVSIIIELKTGWAYFFSGLIPPFITWLFLYYVQDMKSDSILSNKIATLFSMPNHHLLFILVSLIMGIIGGLAAVAGGSLKNRKKSKSKSF